MFSWMDYLGLSRSVAEIRSEWGSSVEDFFPGMFVLSAPFALWVMAYILLIESVWGKNESWQKSLWKWSLPLVAVASEFAQHLGLLRGTFDTADLAALLMTVLIAGLLTSVPTGRRKQKMPWRPRALASACLAALTGLLVAGSEQRSNRSMENRPTPADSSSQGQESEGSAAQQGNQSGSAAAAEQGQTGQGQSGSADGAAQANGGQSADAQQAQQGAGQTQGGAQQQQSDASSSPSQGQGSDGSASQQGNQSGSDAAAQQGQASQGQSGSAAGAAQANGAQQAQPGAGQAQGGAQQQPSGANADAQQAQAPPIASQPSQGAMSGAQAGQPGSSSGAGGSSPFATNGSRGVPRVDPVTGGYVVTPSSETAPPGGDAQQAPQKKPHNYPEFR